MGARVSVVIPVKDRAQLLARALDALDAQTFRDFEVVVVDDGSSDGSGAVADRDVAGRPVTVLPGGGQGAVHARQVGVAASNADVLAFTDSDCVPEPQWLEEGLRAIDEGADVVNGRTMPERDVLPLERSMGSGLEGLFPTCNVFYRRAAFDEAGGFDSHAASRWGFRPDARSRGDGFGEDTLLGWRVARRGTARYASEAIVRHVVFPPDLVDTLSRTARVAGFPALVKECPELRDTLLQWRWQLGRRSRIPVYALAATLLARQPRAAAAVTAWWTWQRWRDLRGYRLPRRRRAALVPVEMAVDVLTAGALVIGSVKAKSVTL